MADLEKSILDRRKYLKEAKDRGFYNDEYENRSARIYRNAKSDYEMGVEARQQAKENQAEKNRLATQKAYHEAQKAEQENGSLIWTSQQKPNMMLTQNDRTL